MKCPYCEIDLDALSMNEGLKHVLEHKKELIDKDLEEKS